MYECMYACVLFSQYTNVSSVNKRALCSRLTAAHMYMYMYMYPPYMYMYPPPGRLLQSSLLIALISNCAHF